MKWKLNLSPFNRHTFSYTQASMSREISALKGEEILMGQVSFLQSKLVCCVHLRHLRHNFFGQVFFSCVPFAPLTPRFYLVKNFLGVPFVSLMPLIFSGVQYAPLTPWFLWSSFLGSAIFATYATIFLVKFFPVCHFCHLRHNFFGQVFSFLVCQLRHLCHKFLFGQVFWEVPFAPLTPKFLLVKFSWCAICVTNAKIFLVNFFFLVPKAAISCLKLPKAA